MPLKQYTFYPAWAIIQSTLVKHFEQIKNLLLEKTLPAKEPG